MKRFRSEEYVRQKNPNPGGFHMEDILTDELEAKAVGGIFGIMPPGHDGPYHYHRERESLIMVISGEAIEIVEGEETPIKAGDILFIAPGEKHMISNRSDQELRFLEFFTFPPVLADFEPVK